MRPEKHLVTDVESVARIARGMTDRNVERVEVIVGAFDFRTVFDGVAHRDKDVFDFLTNDCQGMAMADAPAISWKGNIDGFAFERAVLFPLGNRRLQRLQRRFDL